MNYTTVASSPFGSVFVAMIADDNGTPEVLDAHAHRVREAGVQVIGGCCGSTPEHIEMVSKVLSGEIPVPDVTVEAPTAVSTVDRDGRRASGGRRRRRAIS